MKPTIAGLLDVAATFGISMQVDGDSILLEGPGDMPEPAVDALRESKPMLLDFLIKRDERWDGDRWRG
jgi:hypothetical protein